MYCLKQSKATRQQHLTTFLYFSVSLLVFYSYVQTAEQALRIGLLFASLVTSYYPANTQPTESFLMNKNNSERHRKVANRKLAKFEQISRFV